MRTKRTVRLKVGSIIFILGLFVFCNLDVSAKQQGRKAAITLTERGVGPITSRTPFRVAAIAKVLPGLKVVATRGSFEGFDFPTITVLDGETELFIIGPSEGEKSVGSVVVTSNQVLYNGKGRIGSLYSDIYGDSLSDKCVPGAEDDTGKVFCPAVSSSHIRFVFSPVNDSDAVLPWPQTLKRMRVSEIVWRPDAA